MPLLQLEDIADDTQLGLWRIQEEADWFLQQLSLSDVERLEFQSIHAAGRRLEWLAGRHLVKLLAWNKDIEYNFQKDGYGKPHLLRSGYHISISHSHGICAAMVSPSPCGTDVQQIVGKIERLAPKFLRPEEMESLSLHHRLFHLHVFWGAKESLYKAYGRKSLDFRDHILVEPFVFNPAGGYCKGRVLKDRFKADFHIHYRFRDDYVWVYALQKT